jgi:hypothetical protein
LRKEAKRPDPQAGYGDERHGRQLSAPTSLQHPSRRTSS